MEISKKIKEKFEKLNDYDKRILAREFRQHFNKKGTDLFYQTIRKEGQVSTILGCFIVNQINQIPEEINN